MFAGVDLAAGRYGLQKAEQLHYPAGRLIPVFRLLDRDLERGDVRVFATFRKPRSIYVAPHLIDLRLIF